MPIISPTLPNDGETAEAADVNTVFEEILDLLNGNLDADNITAGSLSWASLGDTTGDIPAESMEENGNLPTFRSDFGFAKVNSGCVWSALTDLDGAMTSGAIYSTNGDIVSVLAIATRAFTASKDTYVSVSPTGTVTYQEVANGATAPTLTADYLWLAKVVSGGSAITSVKDLRLTKNFSPGQVPIGAVLDYWSDGNMVPFGWAICDGSVLSDADSPLNGKTLPSLTSKFTRGTANADLQTTPVTGGADTHTLVTGELPAHTHPAPNGSVFVVGDGTSTASITTGSASFEVEATTGSTGSGTAHNNIPAYVGMVKIIRIK